MRPFQLLVRCCRYTLPLLFLTPLLASAQTTEALTVKARDIADNSPIAGATVSLYDNENQLVGTKVTSAEEGSVVFEFTTVGVHDQTSHLSTLGTPHPNPFASQTTIGLSTGTAGEVSIGLYDVLGRPVLTTAEYLSAGSHQLKVDMGDLPAGRYLVRVTQ